MALKDWIYRQSLSENTQSISYRLRKKRMDKFFSYYSNEIYSEVCPNRVTVLDLGGEAVFWNACNDFVRNTSDITMINLESKQNDKDRDYFKSIVGDATDLSMFGNQSVDLAFSNSVIEHVGGFENQKKMADEMKRVGRHIYIQTPNFFFPIEPHFQLFFVHYLPLKMRTRIVEKKWKLDHDFAVEYVSGIELLTYGRLKKLFPGCKVRRERFFGLTKSFIIYY